MSAEQQKMANDETIGFYGMGWLPDYPDLRDYTPAHYKIQPLLEN